MAFVFYSAHRLVYLQNATFLKSGSLSVIKCKGENISTLTEAQCLTLTPNKFNGVELFLPHT